MYVLARSNLTEMLLNVEYMMELMDPALQLGEGESPPPHTHHRRPATQAHHLLPSQVDWQGPLRKGQTQVKL